MDRRQRFSLLALISMISFSIPSAISMAQFDIYYGFSEQDFLISLVFGAVCGLTFFVAWLVGAYFIYNDSQQRGDSNAMVWALITGCLAFISGCGGFLSPLCCGCPVLVMGGIWLAIYAFVIRNQTPGGPVKVVSGGGAALDLDDNSRDL